MRMKKKGKKDWFFGKYSKLLSKRKRKKLIKKRRSRDIDENDEEEKKNCFLENIENCYRGGEEKINLKNEEAETRMMKKGKKNCFLENTRNCYRRGEETINLKKKWTSRYQ